ncbi:MAG: hypothetical protein QOG80_1192 [Pseudonocardiales bacterium]|nr:hypothetical protein [Pseudonocardiales bacterium]
MDAPGTVATMFPLPSVVTPPDGGSAGPVKVVAAGPSVMASADAALASQEDLTHES